MLGKYREDYFLAQDVIDKLNDAATILAKLEFFRALAKVEDVIETMRTFQINVSDEYNERGS